MVNSIARQPSGDLARTDTRIGFVLTVAALALIDAHATTRLHLNLKDDRNDPTQESQIRVTAAVFANPCDLEQKYAHTIEDRTNVAP